MRVVKIMKYYTLAIILLSLFSFTQAKRLSQFNYGSASVLPFYTEENQKYVILTREHWGRDSGTYDDFGGKRDRGEKHSVVTAAREFWEEGILDKTIDLSLLEVQDYIDIAQSENTAYIIAATQELWGKTYKHVTYVTDFTPYVTEFLDTFYDARWKATKTENKEKDKIALIAWNDLQDAIVKQKESGYPGVYVSATLIDPKTKKKMQKLILLRPSFVSKLRGFFCGDEWECGEHEKMRFYTTEFHKTQATSKPRVRKKRSLKNQSDKKELYYENVCEENYVVN